MEKKLKKLFEYQKFEQNERLAKLIAETEARQAAEIPDDDLEMVTAAGEITMEGKKLLNNEEILFGGNNYNEHERI